MRIAYRTAAALLLTVNWSTSALSRTRNTVCGDSQTTNPTVLIQLLKDVTPCLTNDRYCKQATDIRTEVGTDCLGDLVDTVANLHDVRAVPVLGAPAVLSTGGMAINGLGELGHSAALFVNKALATPSIDPDYTQVLIMAASKLLTNDNKHIATNNEHSTISPLDNKDRSQLTAELKLAARNSEPFIRMAAIKGLVASRDSHALCLVKQMSVSDGFQSKFQSKQGFYPVRDEARLSLKGISFKANQCSL